MGNFKSQASNSTELKELSDNKLEEYKALPSSELVKILVPLLRRAILQKDSELINSLRNRDFLQSILFKESGSITSFESFLRMLVFTWTNEIDIKAKMTLSGYVSFIIIVADISLSENDLECLESAKLTNPAKLLLNLAGKSKFLIDHTSINHKKFIQTCCVLLRFRENIKDVFCTFLTKNYSSICAKFPVIVEDMNPAILHVFLLCMPRLDEYTIECVVDYFSFWIRRKFDSNFLPHILRSKMLKVMDTSDFEEWVKCFVICSAKSNIELMKTKLKICPYILMVENITYRLTQSI